MIVPADETHEESVKSATSVADYVLDFLIAVGVAGFLLYLGSIRKGITKVDKKVDDLGDKVTLLEGTVKEQTIVVTEISLCNNVMSRIDFKMQQSLDYISKDDIKVYSFIVKMVQCAKEAVAWAIHNKLKVGEAEIRGRFELINMEIREMLKDLPDEFVKEVRPELRKVSEHHIERVIIIANDELFNSKLDRFFTLTEQSINEILTTVVRARLKHKGP